LESINQYSQNTAIDSRYITDLVDPNFEVKLRRPKQLMD
uniref:Cadherin_C domain-containing protein n=1 Tax=Brugia timori TaxID=42155 RepID=A0A0R3QI67_9BILA